MKLLRKQVLVRVSVPEEVVTESGIIIPIKQGREYAGASNYNQTKYEPTHGEVVEVSDDCSCQVGDIVLFHYNQRATCKQQGRISEDDLIIEENRLVAIIRDGNLIPTEGWVIARRAEPPKKEVNGFIVPEAYQKGSDRKFRVVSVHFGYEDCQPGDVIYTEPDCDRSIQANDLFNIIENDLFKIETKDILAVEI